MSPLIGMNILKLLQQGLTESWDIIAQTSTPRIQSERIVRGSSFTEPKTKPEIIDLDTNSETTHHQRRRTLDRKKKSTSTDKVTERKAPRKATKTNPQ